MLFLPVCFKWSQEGVLWCGKIYPNTVSFGSLLLRRVKALNINTKSVRAGTTSLIWWNKFHSKLFLLKNKTNIPHIFKYFYHSSNTTSNHIYARNAKKCHTIRSWTGKATLPRWLTTDNTEYTQNYSRYCCSFQPMLLGCTASQMLN